MRDKAQVIGITKTGMVEVIPLMKDTCLSCGVQGCAKRGKMFTVANPRNFALESGMMVSVSASSRHQATQAIISIALPIICALASQLAINYYTTFAQTIVSDGLKAAILLLTLFASATLIFTVRTKSNLIQSEITEIVE